MLKHRVFISYYHADDQQYKNQLLGVNDKYNIFTDMSVDTYDIDDTGKTPERIREIIRDDYLKDSSVLIVLVGKNTKKRKHIDWEIYSSMYDGIVNKKMGILVITLPTIEQISRLTSDQERRILQRNMSINDIDCIKIDSLYPYLPERIADSLKRNTVKISIVDWYDALMKPLALETLIDCAYNNRTTNNYDLSRPMMTYNK